MGKDMVSILRMEGGCLQLAAEGCVFRAANSGPSQATVDGIAEIGYRCNLEKQRKS